MPRPGLSSREVLLLRIVAGFMALTTHQDKARPAVPAARSPVAGGGEVAELRAEVEGATIPAAEYPAHPQSLAVAGGVT